MKTNSIGFKLSLLIVILLVFSLFIVTVLSINRESHFFYSEMESQSEITLSILETSIINYLYFDDIDALSELMESIGRSKNKYLVASSVYNSEGRKIADAFNEDSTLSFEADPLGLEILKTGDILFEWAEETFLVGKVIKIEEEILGAISLTYSTNDLFKRNNEHIRKTVLVVLVESLFSFFIIVFFIKTFTNPIVRMAKYTEEITEGHFDKKMEVKRKDELGILAKSFNGMMDVINNNINALRNSKERYALVVEGSNDGVWDWDLENDVIFYSDRWKGLLGCSPEMISEETEEWFSRVYFKDLEELRAKLDSYIQGSSDVFEHEYRMRHNDGNLLWVLSRGSAIKNNDGKVIRIAGSLTDITDQKNSEEKLVKLALYDYLTDLPNRVLFMDRLRQHHKTMERKKGYNFAIMFIDFDEFKNINDNFGHSAGDALLIEVTKRIQGCLRSVDTLARLAGDEFVIILDEIQGEEEPITVSERIKESLSKAFVLEGKEIYITVSIGIAISNHNYKVPEKILQDADIAMYFAKIKGKNQSRVFSDEMREFVKSSWELENDIPAALENEQFFLVFQPIVDLENESLYGFEALIRWQHPERGLLGPFEFIEFAENTGIITKIDMWVFETVCNTITELADLYKDNNYVFHINISGKNFTSYKNLAENIIDKMKQKRISNNNIIIEVTESSVIESLEIATHELNKIRDYGIRIELDDFGTGYSSLSYLNRMPVSGLKIDRSFVSNFESDLYKKSIINAVIGLSKELGLETIAEGIEDKQQYCMLSEMGCDYAQGYYFSKPLKKENMINFIKHFENFTEDKFN